MPKITKSSAKKTTVKTTKTTTVLKKPAKAIKKILIYA